MSRSQSKQPIVSSSARILNYSDYGVIGRPQRQSRLIHVAVVRLARRSPRTPVARPPAVSGVSQHFATLAWCPTSDIPAPSAGRPGAKATAFQLFGSHVGREVLHKPGNIVPASSRGDKLQGINEDSVH